MSGEIQRAEVWTWKQPVNPGPCLVALPLELHFRIINLALASGRERDVSALARTSKTMYFIVNHELYRLVIKHKTFFLVHWAAKEDRLDVLQFALAHGADPNQMRTSSSTPFHMNNNSFRPLGYDLQARTDVDLNSCVWLKRLEITKRGSNHFYLVPPVMWWRRIWFSSASLSTPSSAQMTLLVNHYEDVKRRDDPNIAPLTDGNEDKLVDLPEPLDEDFTFPESMSPMYMDRRDTKLSFVRLFQYWDMPLHIAAAHDRVSITKALLEKGGDMDGVATEACRCLRDAMPTSHDRPRPMRGNRVVAYTPLHVAICMGSYGVAKVLIDAGADRMAKRFRSNGVREWLAENALHRALSWRDGVGFDYNFIEYLLGQGYAARVEERNWEDMTALQIACQAVNDPAQMDVLRLLLRRGADHSSQCLSPPGTQISQTLRHDDRAPIGLWASRQGSFEVARLLLEHGADAKARSSTTHETMLFAVCTARNLLTTRADMPIEQRQLLDALLARGTARDLNTFYANDHNLLMGLLQARIFGNPPTLNVDQLEFKLFTAGADIMAGADMGKVTPFERMIIDVFDRWYHWVHGLRDKRKHLTEACGKMLVILQVSRINTHPHRPTAMLNQFWGILQRNSLSIGAAVYILPTLIRAGFSPAEADRHGDTAMTSFLQHLLENPWWARHDSKALCHNARGWVLPMLMALLQENGAALHKANNKNLTAFDYLDQIVEYEGEDGDLVTLRETMRRSVRVGLDDHGAKCYKFHPMALFGKIHGDDTILRLLNNPSRWLACEHLCDRGHCRGFSASWQCACTETPIQTLAKCNGDCCLPRPRGRELGGDFAWVDDRYHMFG